MIVLATLFFSGFTIASILVGVALARVWKDKEGWEIRRELFVGHWPESFEEWLVPFRYFGPLLPVVLFFPIVGGMIVGANSYSDIGLLSFFGWTLTIIAGWFLERRILSKFNQD